MTPRNTCGQIELDILYEPKSSGPSHNRLLKLRDTDVPPHQPSFLTGQDILYFCEIGPESKYTIHRGDKSGEIVATCGCVALDGDTDIVFTDPSRTTTICLGHEHYEFPVMRPVTRFTVEGVKYHWRGHEELVADDSKVVLANISQAWPAAEDAERKVDRLVITVDGQDMMDVVAATALIVHTED